MSDSLTPKGDRPVTARDRFARPLLLPIAMVCALAAGGCSSGDDDPPVAAPTTTGPVAAGGDGADAPTTGEADTPASGGGLLPGGSDAPAAPGGTSMPAPGDGSLPGGTDAPATPGGTSMPAPGTMPGAPAPTVFDGDWLRACALDDEEAPEEGYSVTELNIAGDTATLRGSSFADAACTVPQGTPSVITAVGSFAYPGGSTDTPLGAALHVDTTVESIEFDGAAPAPEVLTRLTADGLFETEYDIVIVSGSELYFGDFDADPDLDGATPERRPTALETPPFVRQ